ncbi:MAG: hypothetical protein CMB99_00280 [Flavobacteriaceae bacterium]|nr:hypothetical protein [Flavobacteriaceae bacterium]
MNTMQLTTYVALKTRPLRYSMFSAVAKRTGQHYWTIHAVMDYDPTVDEDSVTDPIARMNQLYKDWVNNHGGLE